jgi:hypothetical protein
MTNIIGIRAEDKNHWERRSPLIPAHIGEHGIVLKHERKLNEP